MFASGDETLAAYRSAHGTTPEALEALCWLARGALADKLYDRANQYVDDARSPATAALATASGAGDPRLLSVVGSGLEIGAFVLTEQGDRSELSMGFERHSRPIATRRFAQQIQSNIALLSLEGHPAPPLDAGVSIGTRVARETDASGRRPMLLFFWAH